MHVSAITLKRERKKYTPTVEVRAECPLCGHSCILVFTGGEKEFHCPDKYCPNCKDRHEE